MPERGNGAGIGLWEIAQEHEAGREGKLWVMELGRLDVRFKLVFPSLSCLVWTEEVEKMSKKMEEVKEGNIRVVSEDFLQDVAASAKSFQELVSAHLLSPWGAAVKEEPEPVHVEAPKGKSAAASSKKSKAPVKEEGEAALPSGAEP